MEEPSLLRQLLEPPLDEDRSPGERRGFGDVPWGWGDMALVGGAGLALNLALLPLTWTGVAGAVRDPGVAFFLQALLSYTAMLGVVCLVGPLHHHIPLSSLGFRPVDLPRLAGLLGVLAGFIVVANLLVGMVIHLPTTRNLFLFGHGGEQFLLTATLVVVAAPLAEEVFFRGFLLQGVANRLGFWPAAVLTSALFALAHVWWQSFLPIFILGMAFSWLFWRTGSVWSAIAAHATINGTSLLMVLLIVGRS